MEAAIQLVLPLLGQVARADDEAALQVAASDQLLHEQPGHDGLTRSWIVRKEEAEGLARQHLLVDGGDLVGQRLDVRGVHGQHGIEEVSEADAVGLRDQAEQRAIAVEASRAAPAPRPR